MKLKHLLLAVPLLVPLLYNDAFGDYISNVGFNYNSPRTITNQQTNNGGEYIYSTDNLGNFKTVKDNVEHNFWYFTRYGNPNSFMVMGWKNGELYVFLTQTDKNNTITIQHQGYVSGFAILPSDYQFNTGGNIKNDIPLITERDSIKTILGKHNIIGFHASNKNDSANGGNSSSQYYGNFMFFANNYVSNYCLITDDDIEHYICFRNSPRITNSNFYENNLKDSENKTTTNRKDIIQFDAFYNEESPIIQGGGGGSSWGDLVELESAYSVSEVLNAYGEMGYTNNLCYGNFALDDLAVSGSTQQFFEQNLDDGVYFTGASIFDLYRVYSGLYNFNTFMNSWLARFYPSYTNDISLGFIGYSKALWYNQYLIYIHRSTIQNFSYQNLYNFCYLSVAINNGSVSLDDNFNSSMINNGSLPSSVEEELESPGSILIPGTGSIFNGSGFTPGSGGAGGGGRSRGEGDEPSDAYGLFARLFDYISGLSDAVDLGLTHKGILPSVIQFGFLVALLYYILKR